MLTYEDCAELMASAKNKRKGKPIANNTRLYETRDNLYYSIELHGNEIIKVYPEGWQIFTCGWTTVTTKARLNDLTRAYVYQRDWQWYISTTGFTCSSEDKKFVEGMFITDPSHEPYEQKTYISYAHFKMKSMPKLQDEELVFA